MLIGYFPNELEKRLIIRDTETSIVGFSGWSISYVLYIVYDGDTYKDSGELHNNYVILLPALDNHILSLFRPFSYLIRSSSAQSGLKFDF